MCSVQELPLEGLTIDANEEVITTLFTVGAFFLIALRTPVVPMIAGSRRSFLTSVTLKWNYIQLLSAKLIEEFEGKILLEMQYESQPLGRQS